MLIYLSFFFFWYIQDTEYKNKYTNYKNKYTAILQNILLKKEYKF